jgi:hypothetical protein
MPVRLITRCALVFGLAVPNLLSAQAMQQTSNTSNTSPMTMVCNDKVLVTYFTNDIGLKRPGVFTLKMRNPCTGNGASSVTVPWQITDGSSTIGSGTTVIPPGGTVEVWTSWNTHAGTFVFGAVADPNNTLNEPASARTNNTSATFSRTFTDAAIAFANPATSVSNPMACQDQVALTQLAFSPTSPTRNQSVTLSLTIEQLCDGTRAVPWRITLGNSVIASGTANMTGISTRTVTGIWVAVAGTHSLSAELDPARTLSDMISTNNRLANPITLTVAQ